MRRGREDGIISQVFMTVAVILEDQQSFLSKTIRNTILLYIYNMTYM